jgi:UPF0716 protein FxsA
VPALLVAALIVVPLVEIYVLIQVGQVIGAPCTVLLLLLDGLLGAWLLRREGRRTLAAFRSATARGRLPANEVADGALVVFGGALMLTPGFVTDLVGIACVLPPTRAVLRRVLLARLGERLLGQGAGGQGAGGQEGRASREGRGRSGRRGRAAGGSRVVDGDPRDP